MRLRLVVILQSGLPENISGATNLRLRERAPIRRAALQATQLHHSSQALRSQLRTKATCGFFCGIPSSSARLSIYAGEVD